MPLTDTATRNTKLAQKDQKLFDGDGLFLLVTPSGHRYWRMKYRYQGKEKKLAIGVYPGVPLRNPCVTRKTWTPRSGATLCTEH